MKLASTLNDYSAAYGYIITSSRERGVRRPLGAISGRGQYETACPDSENGVDMAVYPTRIDAEEAIREACGESDPSVFDGLSSSSLKHTRNTTAAQCAVYGWVTYPAGKPVRTDYENMYS